MLQMDLLKHCNHSYVSYKLFTARKNIINENLIFSILQRNIKDFKLKKLLLAPLSQSCTLNFHLRGNVV